MIKISLKRLKKSNNKDMFIFMKNFEVQEDRQNRINPKQVPSVRISKF